MPPRAKRRLPKFFKKPKHESFWAQLSLPKIRLKQLSLKNFGWKQAVILSVVLAVWGAASLALVIAYFSHDLPSVKKLAEVPKSHNMRILANDGKLIAILGSTYGNELKYDDLPPVLVKAVLATEDRRFFWHFGVDFIGLARAAFTNFKAGRVVQGGSTVTQQLAKIAFLSPERTMKRKIQEMVLALWLEWKFTKKEILTLYLNRVYLGEGFFGVDAASRGFFGKPAKELTLSEAAILAGMLKAPSRFGPYSNPELAQSRAEQVLKLMVDAGYIKKSQAVYKDVSLLSPPIESNAALYFADWITSEIPSYVGIVDEDITVWTTLDPGLQKAAEENMAKIMETEIKSGKKGAEVTKTTSEAMHASQSALLSMTPKGDVLAMVGGRDYKKSKFNRVTQAERQPGSSFKLFVYLAAMDAGMSPGDTMVDEPISINGYEPANYYNEYRGEMNLRRAFALSINTIAVQLIYRVTPTAVVDMAYRLGVRSQLGYDLSLALGTSEVTLLDMTQAFAHIANGGYTLHANGIVKVENRKGDVLYERGEYQGERILDSDVVMRMNSLLSAVTEFGTGTAANIGRPIAGKTGTSQDYRDAWFLGFTPQIITGVWVGNDDNTSMRKVTGGTLPAQIWRNYMKVAMEGKPVEDIPALYDEGSGFEPNYDIPVERPLERQQMERQQGQREQRQPREERRGFWDSLFGSDDPRTQPHTPAAPIRRSYDYPNSR